MSFMNKPIAKFGETLTKEELKNFTVFGEKFYEVAPNQISDDNFFKGPFTSSFLQITENSLYILVVVHLLFIIILFLYKKNIVG